jgi:hypothetical protein
MLDVFIDYPKDQNITWNAIVVHCDKQITNGVMNKIAFNSCFFMCTPLLVVSFVVASILEGELFVFSPLLQGPSKSKLIRQFARDF